VISLFARFRARLIRAEATGFIMQPVLLRLPSGCLPDGFRVSGADRSISKPFSEKIHHFAPGLVRRGINPFSRRAKRLYGAFFPNLRRSNLSF